VKKWLQRDSAGAVERNSTFPATTSFHSYIYIFFWGGLVYTRVTSPCGRKQFRARVSSQGERKSAHHVHTGVPGLTRGGAPRRPSPLSARVEAARMFAPLGAGVVPARRGCEWCPSTWNPVDKRIQRYRMGDVRDTPSCAAERVEVLAVATCVSWSLSTPPWHPSRRRYARWSGRIGRLR
jgi:hypothetical protein